MADKTRFHPAEDSPAATASPDATADRAGTTEGQGDTERADTERGDTERGDTERGDGERIEALAVVERERDDFRDRWLRKTAEFENYRKRIERERREQADQAVIDLLRELLEVVDDFDLALTVDAGQGAGTYRKGVEMIHAKLHDILKKYGVRPIEALGADFDPNLHQAVSHEPSAGHRDGEVIDELRRGYMINDRLLRPAMVKVAKA